MPAAKRELDCRGRVCSKTGETERGSSAIENYSHRYLAVSAAGLFYCPPTFSVLYPRLRAFPETCRDVIYPWVADSEAENTAVGAAALFWAAEPLADVVDPAVVDPGIVFDTLVFAADVAEPQASADIALAFDVSAPVSVDAVEVDSPGRPRFFVLPNIDSYSSSSSSDEVVDNESAHSSSGVRANCGLCSILSSRGLHHNKNLVHCYNTPNPGYNSTSDTNDLPMDATISHSRKIYLHLYQGHHTHHTYQALRSHSEVLQISRAAAEGSQYLYSPLP